MRWHWQCCEDDVYCLEVETLLLLLQLVVILTLENDLSQLNLKTVPQQAALDYLQGMRKS